MWALALSLCWLNVTGEMTCETWHYEPEPTLMACYALADQEEARLRSQRPRTTAVAKLCNEVRP